MMRAHDEVLAALKELSSVVADMRATRAEYWDQDAISAAVGAADLAISIAAGSMTDNESLVAAAPELLAALKAVVAVLQAEAPGTPLNHHKYDALGIQAHAAIAKAEGRRK